MKDGADTVLLDPAAIGLAAERGYWSEALRELVRDWVAMTGLIIVIVLALAAIFAPQLAPYDPTFQHRDGLGPLGEPMPPGTPGFLLGTDALGRDLASRLAYGARISLVVGIGANLLAALIGVVVGGVAGMAGRRLQTAIMRMVDIVLSFPVLLLAVALLAVTQPSLRTIILIVGIAFGSYLARIIYTQVVSLRERDFVLAARTCGVSGTGILVHHIVPHVLPTVIVYGTLGVATAIMLEATLSYVGIGIRPPEASWGNMISDGQPHLIAAPWLMAMPAVALVLAMVGFSLLGDGLRDALDPTLERGRRPLGGIR